MTLEELLPEDKWLKFVDLEQLKRIKLLSEYVKTHDLMLDFRDRFPRQVDKDSFEYFYPDHIYKYDISINPSNLKTESLFGGYGAGQFIVDKEKIIVRPLYSTEAYSINQREIIFADFKKYLNDNNIKFSSN